MIMDISSATNTLNASNKQQSGPALKSLGKEDFLRLLTVQLKAQNPLNPMDSTAFTAQLAQFSSLEQLTNINGQLTNMISSQKSLQNTMATSLIGKRVKVAGNTVQLNGQADLYYSLPGDAAKVTISIYDANGSLVQQKNLLGQTAGEHSLLWDGKDKDGFTRSAGQYVFTVDAVDGNGKVLSAATLTAGTVTGVGFENNGTYLSIDGTRKVGLGDIREIGGV
jgi:flagellar basal-body rod modification protein FlgD